MKLITFGCSVTHLKGVKEELASLLNLELLDQSESASSNQLQISKLSELIVNQQINKDDIIYWQVTSVERDYNCLPISYLPQVKEIQQTQFGQLTNPTHYVESMYPNVFDRQIRLHLLCNSTMLITPYRDDTKMLEQLLSTLLLLKQLCAKTFVVFGWESAMPDEHLIVFKQKLRDYQVDFIEEGFVDYTARNKLPFGYDDMHPSEQAGQEFAKEVFNKMKLLGWV